MNQSIAIMVTCWLLGMTTPATAQSSASYDLKESVFNAGGHPESGTVLVSASFSISIDAIGDALHGGGLNSSNFGMDGGFLPAYAPPGEVHNLAFTDHATLAWDAEFSAGLYNLYRGDLNSLAVSNSGACEQPDLINPTATDGASPTIGSGWFYLVAVKNRLGEEGTRGFDSAAAMRPATGTCP